MASLKKILGSNIQVLDDDPVQNVGSWSSISSGNTARTSTFSIGQSYTAMAAVGGLDPGTTPKAETETWNGTAWTEVNDMPAGKGDHASAGTLTAAFAATGFQPWPNSPTVNFDWDGTNWTAGGSVNTGRYGAMGAGTLTAGMIAGGIIPPGANYSDTVEL